MNQLPQSVLRLFWGDNLQELDWPKHKDYISKTVLEKGDTGALRWLFKSADINYLRKLVGTKKLDPKSQNFWSIYLS